MVSMVTSRMWRQSIECIGLVILATSTAASRAVPQPPLLPCYNQFAQWDG